MFAAAVVPAAAFLLSVLFIPESPRWLAGKGAWEHARQVLFRLGNGTNVAGVLEEIRDSLAVAAPAGGGATGALRFAGLVPVLMVGVTLAVLQQWCGINVIFNYAQEVFSAAGYPLSGILFDIVITGVTMCVFTFVAIATVERLGRRPLMLFGCASLTCIYAAVGYLYHTNTYGLPLLVLIVAAIACYAMTLAPITWVILSEIFPNSVRGACMALCTASLWMACFVLTYTFPLLNASIGTAGTFWFYALICGAGFLFVLARVPETRQKSLEAIQQLWRS